MDIREYLIVLAHLLLIPVGLDSQRYEINNYLQEIKFYHEPLNIAVQFILLPKGFANIVASSMGQNS